MNLENPHRYYMQWDEEVKAEVKKIPIPEKFLDAHALLVDRSLLKEYEVWERKQRREIAIQLNQPYYKRKKELEDDFRLELESEYNMGRFDVKVRDAVYSKAWEDGHAGGFGDVRNHYIDLVEFVKKILT